MFVDFNYYFNAYNQATLVFVNFLNLLKNKLIITYTKTLMVKYFFYDQPVLLKFSLLLPYMPASLLKSLRFYMS